jgi:hypothetical protein
VRIPVGLINKRSGRVSIVDHERIWKKHYMNAVTKMYTDENELVVEANDDGRACVVIAEDEGPLFEYVWNTTFDQKTREVSYIALKDEQLFRVSVSL